MPVESNMMFARPRNCRFCEHGYRGLGHMVDFANARGLWDITDVQETDVNKTNIHSVIDLTDPLSFYGFGHGNNCVYTGDDETPIFDCDDCSALSGRVVYLMSCLTANGLGPEIIRQGALAYAGFNVSWTWLAETDANDNFVYPDPYDDHYAYGFWDAANELWKSLIEGDSFREAVNRSRAKYDEWIDYWFYVNPGDKHSQDCIKYLALDRDSLVGLDLCDALTDQSTCAEHGCFWYNDSCHSVPASNGGFNPLLLAPIVALVGIVLLVGSRQ